MLISSGSGEWEWMNCLRCGDFVWDFCCMGSSGCNGLYSYMSWDLLAVVIEHIENLDLMFCVELLRDSFTVVFATWVTFFIMAAVSYTELYEKKNLLFCQDINWTLLIIRRWVRDKYTCTCMYLFGKMYIVINI